MNTLSLPALAIAGLLAAALADPVRATETAPPAYGENLTTAEARRLGAQVGIAVVDTQGTPLVFERMDGANANAADRAPLKAKAAAIWRRPTLIWGTPGAGAGAATGPNESRPNGGEMIIKGGKVVGGLGISSNPAHEAQIAKLAAASLQ